MKKRKKKGIKRRRRDRRESRAVALANPRQQFQNEIRGAGAGIHELLRRSHPHAKPDTYRQFVSALGRWSGTRYRLARYGWPRHLRDLKAVAAWDARKLEDEIEWAAAFLPLYAPQLKSFVALRERLEQSWLNEDYRTCETTIASIKRRFGESLWLLKCELAIAQSAHGTDSQKILVASARSRAGTGSFAAYVATYVSIRNEPSLTVERFGEFYLRRLREHPTEFDEYLQYHILPRVHYTKESLASILAQEALGSTIDYYECLLFVCRAAHAAAVGVDDTTLKALSWLNGVSDRRVSVLRKAILREPQSVSARSIDRFDLFAQGNYDQCMGLSAGLTLDDFDDLECLARAYALNPAHVGPSPGNGLVTLVASVLRQRAGWQESVRELLKRSANASSMDWSVSLRDLLAEHSHSADASRPFQELLAATSGRTHPLRVRTHTPREYVQRHVAALQQAALPPAAAEYVARLSDVGMHALPPTHLTTAEALRADALAAGSHERPDIGVSVARRLIATSTEPYQAIGSSALINSLVGDGRINDALQVACDAILADPLSFAALPLANIVADMTPVQRKQLRASIYLPIALDLTLRQAAVGSDTHRSFAFERFLSAHGVQRPSELTSIAQEFDIRAAVYFLRNVCVEQVMERAVYFDSSVMVQEERLQVCLLLARIDPDSAAEYHAEILALSRQLAVVRKGQELESSRVYVNVDGVVDAATERISADFTRFRELMKQGAPYDGARVSQAVRQYLQNDAAALTGLSTPDDDPTELLGMMVFAIKDDFLFSRDHGLDSYLSVRVRHGALEGQIRGTLEKSHLITQRTGNKNYKANEHVRSLLGSRQQSWSGVSEVLAEFSHSIDKFIRQLSTEWIQINRDKFRAGRIRLQPKERELIGLAAVARQCPSAVTLVAAVVSLLEFQLQRALTQVRAELESIGGETFDSIFSRLEADLRRAIPCGNEHPVMDVVRSGRIEVQRTLSRIVSWFSLAPIAAHEPFLMEDAIQVVASAMSLIAPSALIDVQSIGADAGKTIAGIWFLPLIDILFIILHNATRHSGLANPVIAGTVAREGDMITIAVRNDVDPLCVDDAARSRVEAARGAVRAGDYASAINTEGGTGLLKICSIGCVDASRPERYSFGFTGCQFRLSLSINIGSAPRSQRMEMVA